MAMPQRDDPPSRCALRRTSTIETQKRPAKWSAEAFGEGGYEVVPPEKEAEFRKMADADNRRRRPGMYADNDVATGTPAQGQTVGNL